jgi:hypothetical protein
MSTQIWKDFEISARPSKTLIAMPFLEDSLSMSKSVAAYVVSDKFLPTNTSPHQSPRL